MTTKNEQSLRNKYFANEIFRIGEIVEDVSTGEEMKIIDRGSNYVTVATTSGIVKKWLSDVQSITEQVVLTEVKTSEEISSATKVSSEYTLQADGQISLFGYTTKNFDMDVSSALLEQFQEFDDLYSQHQIIKCMDLALSGSDDESYEYALKTESFLQKQNATTPFILEYTKTTIERNRIAKVLASVANIEPAADDNKTVGLAIEAFKKKYKSRTQWQVLFPFLKIAKDAGLSMAMANLPYSDTPVHEDVEYDTFVSVLEENFDMLVSDLEFDDILETYDDSECSDELLTEVLSIATRTALGHKMKQHEQQLTIRRDRALNRAATTTVLMDRARRLAETMLKRRMFHKSPADMSRQEKERFESGANRRQVLVARLAQKLLPKVRELQTSRIHHQPTPVVQTKPEHNNATGAA